jgi:Integrase core domain
MVETFFKTLKSDLVWRTIFYTRQQATQAIGGYIDGSIIPSGAIPPWISQARHDSKNKPPKDPMPLH